VVLATSDPHVTASGKIRTVGRHAAEGPPHSLANVPAISVIGTRERALLQQAQAMAGIAMTADKYARNYHASLRLAATLHWLISGVSKTS
jgi:hypothetical protein